MLVGNGSQLLDIGDVELRIAERLGEDGACLWVDGGANAVEVVGVGEADNDAHARQRVMEQIVGAPIKGCRRDNLFPCACEGQDRERLSGLSGGRRECRDSTLERRNPLLKDIRRRIHDPGIDIAELLQCEETCGVVRVVEDVGGGLVNGHRA